MLNQQTSVPKIFIHKSHSTPCIQTSASSPHSSILRPPTNPPTTSIQTSQSSMPLEELNMKNMMHASNSNLNDIDIISTSIDPTCSRHSMVFREKAPIVYRAMAGKTKSKALVSNRLSRLATLVSIRTHDFKPTCFSEATKYPQLCSIIAKKNYCISSK